MQLASPRQGLGQAEALPALLPHPFPAQCQGQRKPLAAPCAVWSGPVWLARMGFKAMLASLFPAAQTLWDLGKFCFSEAGLIFSICATWAVQGNP
jgi:hypothetical protein